jgi:hypothetical protein
MSASERNDPIDLIDDARRLHRVLLRRITLLTARPATKPFAVSLVSLARSIERELQREAELSVEEVRTEATIDALAEHIDEMRVTGGIQEMQLGRLAEKSGHLRAERARIEAGSPPNVPPPPRRSSCSRSDSELPELHEPTRFDRDTEGGVAPSDPAPPGWHRPWIRLPIQTVTNNPS